MEIIIHNMLLKKTWAVIGATQTVDKFGHIIFKRLKNAGYTTYAVNPRYKEILEDVCYGKLSELPEIPECLNIVVAPEKVKPYIDEAAKLGIKYLWFQPGSYNKEVVDYARDLGLEVVYQSCVLVELNNRGK